ncbi:hypothetical protein [Marinobacter sp. ELB17]|uniref:hypothetical protein n=1 Tax=Marinobacter sp. ELB17 TaxID=270374 RepID=UPI0012F4CBA5|nr:hypothetical protein [Marinobacter sp. ELB17]
MAGITYQPGQFPANFRSCPWLQGSERLSRGFSQGYPQLLWVKIHGSAKDRNAPKLLAYAWLHQFTYRLISTTIGAIQNQEPVLWHTIVQFCRELPDESFVLWLP